MARCTVNGDVMAGRACTQSGFTYLGALLLIAVMGAMLASVGSVWHTASQREKEYELLYAGDQFRNAIQSYYEKTPGAAKQYPKSLDDLLHDRRHSVVQRHLRKIFIDPMTGSAKWGLLMAEQGGIRGVHSLSGAEAIKTANFSRANRDFEGKLLVGEWHFTHGASAPAPEATTPRPGNAAPPAPPAQPKPPGATSP
jgi:type II secretory pathway pseudopilin PulG